MNKKMQIAVIAALSIIAIASIGTAVHAFGLSKATEAQNAKLLAQIADLESANVATNIEPVVALESTSNETNEAAALKALLAKQSSELDKLQLQLESERSRKFAESFRERMVRIKEEDPERYAEMIQRRTERREEMRYNLAERTATFMDLDTSEMSEEERDNHELLVQKMATIWKLTEHLQNQDPEQPPDRETIRELFSEINEARPLMDQTRTHMLEQLSTDIGYEGEDAQAFANHIEDIISTTTIRSPRRGSGGFRGGGRQP